MPYVGLVASRKRGATVRSLLEDNGVPGVAAVRNPAGLDLGGRTAAEIALSILAEIVQQQASERLRTAAGVGTGRGDERGRSDLRHEREYRDGAPHGGPRRRQILLLCRNLPRDLSEKRSGVRRPLMTDAAAMHDRFRERGFIIDQAFATALQIMLALEKPLLIEGPAGVGKTESAKVLADVLGTRADSAAVL